MEYIKELKEKIQFLESNLGVEKARANYLSVENKVYKVVGIIGLIFLFFGLYVIESNIPKVFHHRIVSDNIVRKKPDYTDVYMNVRYLNGFNETDTLTEDTITIEQYMLLKRILQRNINN